MSWKPRASFRASPSPAAEKFREVLERLGEWGQRWGTTQFDPDNLDLMLLMWNVRRRIASRAGVSRKIATAISGHRTEAIYARSDPG